MARFPSRTLALLTAVVVLPVPALVVLGPAAQAATNDQGLSGVRASMWQTNELVRTLTVSNGVVYAGGDFTSVRPPGSALGSNETARTYLAAFNTSTGALVTSFNVALNGRVYDLAVSPDGTRLYLAGAFTQVNGATRNRVAAVSLPSGSLITGFTANASATATAITATASTVYVGGDFTTIGGRSKSRFASLNAATGAVNTGFTANLDSRPSVVTLAPDGSRLMVGGHFTTINGTAPSGIGSLDPATGSLEPWAANSSQPINSNCSGRVTDIVTRGAIAYVTAEGDPPGCYEGTYAANISDGTMLWNSSCLGAALALTIVDNVLYKASHQHDCGFNVGGAQGGFVGATSRDGFIRRHLVGQNLSDGSFVHWNPDTNGAGATHVGPHTLATDGSQLFVGGDFTRVDGQAQQGIARYGRGNNAAPNNPAAVNVQPTAAGTLTVTWPAVFDRDSGTLTYSLYRDGGSTPVYTKTVESYPWTRPWLRFDDTGLAGGSSHSYRVRVTDGTLQSSLSTAASGVVATSAPPAYATAVQGASPNLYWRLAGNSSLADGSSSGTNTGSTVGAVTTGLAGAIGSNAAVGLDGSTGYLTSDAPLSLGTSFTESAWFRTTSIRGGSIMAMSSQRTGSGGTTDRMITMDNNGNLVLGIKAPGTPTAFGPRLTTVRVQDNSFSDGSWHQVVGTYDGTTLSLYVDGRLLGATVGSAAGMSTGYQRAGYVDLSTMQAVFGINFYNLKWPASEFFDGSIDEVASYNAALTPAQVATQFAAAVGEGTAAPGDTTPPSAPGNVSVDNATTSSLRVSWTAATDDVAVAGYQVFRNGVNVSGTLSSATTSYVDNGLTAGTTYSYVVRALDAAGNSTASGSVPGTTVSVTDTTKPSAPTNLSSSNVTATSARISWIASTDDVGVTGYRVLRGGSDVSGWITGTTYTDTGLAAATTYTYTVQARDAAGNISDASSGLPVTTTAASSSLFSDSFAGSNGAAWGSSWTTSATSGSASIQGNAGQLAFNDVSGAYARAQLSGVAAVADAGATFSYQFNSTAARSFIDIGLRGSGTWQNSYRLRNGYYLEISSTSSTITVSKNINGTRTALASFANGNAVTTAKQRIRYEVAGSTIRIKTWADGSSEPSSWEYSASDSSLTTPGQFFVSMNRASVNTGTKTFAIDDFSLYAP